MTEEPGDTCVKRLTLGQHLRLRNAAGCTVQCCVGMLWITREIRALNRVVHVPVPLILGCIGKGRRNPTLRRHGMRAGWEHLGKHSHFQIRARELERRAHTGAPATDDERVKLTFHLANSLFTGSSIPTMACNCLSMKLSGASVTAHG